MDVLVVEDDVRMASLLRRGLAAEGWSVDVQGDAEDARLALLSTPYDVVVCDIMLPGRMSGLDLCRSMRSVGVWTPFLMLTARTSVEDRVAGLDAGADDYLGKPFAFTAREFALLEYLMRRAGEVVTRSDMLDHVWDYAYDGLSNVVDVYIGYVRKKLRAAGLDGMLRTIRGVGYRLDAPVGERVEVMSGADAPRVEVSPTV